MAKAKSTNVAADGQVRDEGVEPMVIALAEQLGTFLGRVQAKALRLRRSSSSKKTPRSGQADGWLDNEVLREQVSLIRDGAANLLKHVNRASEAARSEAAKSTAVPAKKAAQGRSGGAVDAPGKRHRKPPTQVRIDKRMGEVQGKKAGQKQFKVGKSRGRG